MRRTTALPLVALLLLAHAARGQGPACIYFTAPWCGPCVQMAPEVAAAERAGVKVTRYDFDRDRAKATRLGIHRIPAMIFTDANNREVARIVGGTTAREMQADWALATKGVQAVQGPAQGFQSAAPATDLTPVERAINATVRIKVDDRGPYAGVGTGTIVDTRNGEALAVTCGHLFREGKGRVPVTVERFTARGGRVQSAGVVTAQVVSFDLEADTGLIAFRTSSPVEPVSIADQQPGRGEEVFTVGCSNGAPPTVVNGKVTSLNRYQGPPNIETSPAPVEGRSGGGLFNRNGQLVGVIFAADPEGNEGLHVGLPVVRRLLDRMLPNRPGVIIPRATPAQAYATPVARSNGSAGGLPGRPQDIDPGSPVEVGPGPAQPLPPLEPPTQGTQPVNPSSTDQQLEKIRQQVLELSNMQVRYSEVTVELKQRIDAIKQCNCDHTQRDHDIQLSLTAIQQINQRLTTIEQTKPIDIAAEIARALDHDTPVRVYMPDGRLAGESKTNIFRGGAIDFTFNPRALLDAEK